MVVKNVVIGQKVSKEQFEFAKKLRREATPAEKILWRALRTNKQGYHFRRQQIVFGYFADFYCHAFALIIELDGGVHESQKDYDSAREAHLIERGFRILQFKNEEVENDLNGVLRKILEAFK
ncbi:MAG: DUF559 domain-containing protein [Chloroflexota bacterium]